MNFAIAQAIRSRYFAEGSEQIAKEFGLSRQSVTKRAIRLNVQVDWTASCIRRGRVRKQAQAAKVNEAYFDSWTDGMAYTLGYIWADGCVQSKKRRANEICKSLIFGCVTEDEEILQWVLHDMASQAKISHYPAKDYADGRHGKAYSRCTVYNDHIVDTLMNTHGIIPRKSFLDPAFPSVPVEYLASFLRGVFDGDGAICRHGAKGQWSLDFCGTYVFIQTLTIKLSNLLQLAPRKIAYRVGSKLATISWSRHADLVKLRDYLYPVNKPYFALARKKEKLFGYLETKGYGREPSSTSPLLNGFHNHAKSNS